MMHPKLESENTMKKLFGILTAASLLATPAFAQAAPEPATPTCECCERMPDSRMDCCKKDAEGKMTCAMMQGMDHGAMNHSAEHQEEMDHSQMDHGAMGHGAGHSSHAAAEPQ